MEACTKGGGYSTSSLISMSIPTGFCVYPYRSGSVRSPLARSDLGTPDEFSV
jgi:hypothetical protein